MSEEKTKYDIIIIGAGPAGYTAGIYCSRARHNTLLISGILPGGQLMNTTDVENYPGFDQGIMGPDLMLTMRKQTERMGTKIIDDEVISVDLKNIYYSHFHAVEIDKQLEALTIFSSDETDTFEEVETEIGLNLVETQLNKYDSMLTKFENMEA